MLRGDGEEGVEAALEAVGVLLPELVLQEDAHDVHADGFSVTEFAVVNGWIEGVGLEHLELVDGIRWDVVRADEPGLVGVPVVGLLLGPARTLGRGREGEGEQEYGEDGWALHRDPFGQQGEGSTRSARGDAG
jgi:hypothetical protein